jgi:PAS domain S-box-containing protein
LLHRLKSAGARAAVFDIVFSSASANADADRALADAIRDNGNVTLAVEFNDKTSIATDNEHPREKLGSRGAVYEPFARAAAGIGIASLGIDDDRAVRRFLAGFVSSDQPALAWAAAIALHLPVTQTADAMANANQKWIHYYGPPLTVPHISYSQALAVDGVSDDFFRGKIVFIGARTSVGLFDDKQDEFRSPFHSWKNKELFLPGVEVHATQMLNLVRNDALARTSLVAENLLLVIIAVMFGGGLIWLRPIPATIVALAGAALALVLARVGFSQGVWFPWLVVSGAQIPAALGGSVLFNSLEWYRARKRFEAAKKIADAKIREQAALIDKAHDAILVQDLRGEIFYANPSAEKLFGWRFSEMKPDTTEEMFLPAPDAAKKAGTAAVNDGEWNGELQLQTRAGQIITVDSRWTLIRDDAGKPSGLLLINSDITEKKLLEQQFLRTQRMNTIGTLAGGMAHDLNNALAPVLLGAQLLRRKTSDAHDLKLLSMIETSAMRGADMVRQVLLFARGHGGEFERLELGPLVAELEKMVRETFPKSILVETFLARDLWPVRGNLTQLHQVLLNLCVNARDAMPDGGKLSFIADNVELSAEELKRLQIGVPETVAPSVPSSILHPPSSKFISLAVSDTGTGMTPEVKAKIFEPFFTTKGEGKGTGIGLATVIRILKSHGGFLQVESAVGEGTTFEVFIPCAPEIPVVVAKPMDAELQRGHGELILLADDELALCELVAAELEGFGYRVLTAANGAEALALFKQHTSEVRLFITDTSMPVMSGAQAIAEIRKLRPGLPAILSSSEAGEETIDGVIGLNKPFALAELLAAVNRSLK